MVEDRYKALTSGMAKVSIKKYLQTEMVKQKEPSFRDTVLEIPNDMELGEFIRKWINKNPENGLNIKYLNTEK